MTESGQPPEPELFRPPDESDTKGHRFRRSITGNNTDGHRWRIKNATEGGDRPPGDEENSRGRVE